MSLLDVAWGADPDQVESGTVWKVSEFFRWIRIGHNINLPAKINIII